MSQTAYSVNQGVALEGGLYDIGDNDILSYLVQDSGGILFGKGVAQGTADDQAKLPAAAADVTDKFLGISQAVQGIEADSSGVVKYVQKAAMGVVRKGRVWVKVEEAVAPHDPVYCRYAAGGLGVGSFRKSTGTSEAALVSGAKYLTTAGANGLALVELNLTA